jgi:hypothetical protein
MDQGYSTMHGQAIIKKNKLGGNNKYVTTFILWSQPRDKYLYVHWSRLKIMSFSEYRLNQPADFHETSHERYGS